MRVSDHGRQFTHDYWMMLSLAIAPSFMLQPYLLIELPSHQACGTPKLDANHVIKLHTVHTVHTSLLIDHSARYLHYHNMSMIWDPNKPNRPFVQLELPTRLIDFVDEAVRP